MRAIFNCTKNNGCDHNVRSQKTQSQSQSQSQRTIDKRKQLNHKKKKAAISNVMRLSELG
ncbi:hypothetical protein BK026_09110 [Alteromonas sp. V450]|nr:hypothetical protein BK026_09110 [Alteromonas sp. V450]